MSEAAESSAPKKSGAGKLILFILLGVLALGGAGAGGYFFFAASETENAEQSDEDDSEAEGEDKASGKKKSKKAKKPALPAIYVKLDPALVVNSEDGGMMRFLQVGVEMSTRDPLTADALKTHEPVIRNDLLLLISSTPLAEVKTREGKDKLRGEALKVVQSIIDNEGGSGNKVESIFFTSFVMQ